MTTIHLPWPPTSLSPNARHHYMALARAKKAYRHACFIAVREQRAKLPAGERFDVTLTFTPPNRRSYDRDNLVARMKSGLDGVANALGIDDAQFVRLTSEVMPASGVGVGGVAVRIEQHQPTSSGTSAPVSHSATPQ